MNGQRTAVETHSGGVAVGGANLQADRCHSQYEKHNVAGMTKEEGGGGVKRGVDGWRMAPLLCASRCC